MLFRSAACEVEAKHLCGPFQHLQGARREQAMGAGGLETVGPRGVPNPVTLIIEMIVGAPTQKMCDWAKPRSHDDLDRQDPSGPDEDDHSRQAHYAP